MTIQRKIASGFSFIVCASQLIVLDWIASSTRGYSAKARQELRTLHFRARARIKPIRLAEVVQRLGIRYQMRICCPLPELIGEVGSPASYYTIAAITNARAPKRVLEFGTYLGVGTLTMALNTSQDATIYTIDLPDQVDSESLPTLEHSADKTHIRVSRHRVGEAFTGCESAGKIRQIRADSLTLKLNHPPWGTDSIDMVYVDGEHSFEICKRDSETALSVLSPQGVILWDDYWWFYPDVVRYLDSLSERLRLFRIEDTNLVIYSRVVSSGK